MDSEQAKELTEGACSEARTLVDRCQTRGQFGEWKIDPVHVAEHLGIRVMAAAVDADIAAAAQRSPGLPSTIYLNSTDDVNRQRLVCALELGYFVHRRGQDFVHIRYRDGSIESAEPGEEEERREVFAFAFASELLMPASRMKRLVAEGVQPEKLATVLGVPLPTLVHRLKTLSLFQR